MRVIPLDLTVNKRELSALYRRVWIRYPVAGIYDRCDVRNHGDVPFLVITAYNPGGRQAVPWMNKVVDRILESHLVALGHKPVRVIAGSEDRTHEEESWLVPLKQHGDRQAAVTLLQTFGQVAAFVIRPNSIGGRYLLWNDGTTSS
jgi:hypothetical protein